MTAINTYSDEELLSLLKSGEHDAFTEIYNRYWDKLFVVATNKTGDCFMAEEVVQELFMDLWRRREDINLHGSANIYLAAALKYKVINARLAKNKEQSNKDAWAKNKTGSAQYLQDALTFQQLQQQLESLVIALPQQCQLVYRMSRDQGLSHKQIASQLNISEKTVEAHLTRALKVLRNRFRYTTALQFSLQKIFGTVVSVAK